MSAFRAFEWYVLAFGICLFAACVFPVRLVRRLGLAVASLLQCRVPSPVTRSTSARPFSVPLFQLLGWIFVVYTAAAFLAWHRKYDGPAAHAAKAALELDARYEYEFIKWRSERDLHQRAATAVVYLSLQVFLNLRDETRAALARCG